MTLWDAHMHTSFSGDAHTPPEEMADTARGKQLPGITFTDHLDWDYRETPGMFDLDIEAYLQRITQLQAEYNTENFHIYLGLELGLQPHLAERHRILLDTCPFDFVIGSSHVVHGRDPYYPSYFEGRPSHEAYLEYYESILENIEAFDGFDSYGHLDYVFRYGPSEDSRNPEDTYRNYSDIVDAILEALIRRDKALEVNSGAYRCGLTQPNPSLSVLKRYYELGGRLITIGADAHKPEHVGLRFDLLPQLLTGIGFREYAVYRKRSPILYPLC